MLEKYPYEPPSFFGSETKIVWLSPPRIFPFVRQGLSGVKNSNLPFYLPKREDDFILVGYALQPSDGPGIVRRYFFIKPNDFDVDAGPPPCIGVDPLTVEIGVDGFKTPRCFVPATPEQKSLIAQAIKIYRQTRETRRATERERNAQRKRQGPRPPRRKTRW